MDPPKIDGRFLRVLRFIVQMSSNSPCESSVDLKTSMETLLAEWRASMDEKDRVIHDLAAKMLESRYCPERCNAFLAFIASRKKG